MPEEFDNPQEQPSDSFEESEAPAAEGAPKRSGGGRKPDSAYRQLQSERDTARQQLQAMQQRLTALETRDQASQRQQAEQMLMQQVAQLPEEQQQQALLNYRVQAWQVELAQSRARADNAESMLRARQEGDKLMIAVGKAIRRRDLPDYVGKTPIDTYLMLHARTPEEVEAEADALVEQFGPGKAAAKSEAAPRRPSRYANAEGASAPGRRLSELTADDPAFSEAWRQIRRGDLTLAEAARKKW